MDARLAAEGLDAGTWSNALGGPNGVACLEAHLPAGRLPEVRRRATGAW